MRNTISILFLFFIAFSFSNCGDNDASSAASDSAFKVTGNIAGANALQVYLDKVGISPTSASLVQAKSEVGPNGDFTLSLPDQPDPGIYRLRFGVQKIALILDGTETAVTVNGELAKLPAFEYKIEGSPGSSAYQDMMRQLATQQANINSVTNYIENTPNSLGAMLVAMQAFGGQRSYLEQYNKAKDRLENQYPGSPYINEFKSYIASIQAVKNTGRDFVMLEEGERQPAPDIKLPSPDGTEYALSDLKGKVVLLDFWASWCRPCRMENPHVVKTYKKYKDQGFTVFSVSLDGVDSRTAARYGGDQEKLNQAIEQSKKRWEDAIEKDGLVWDTHVSDLKKWECAPAKSYGVNSIPRTFMIDREGNIAAMNMRGSQVEEVLLELL